MLTLKSEFENLAQGVLYQFDISLDDQSVDKELLQVIPTFGINCMALASFGQRQAFLASPCIQNHLDKVWNGKISQKTDFFF